MQNRILFAGSLLLATTVALGAVVDAQAVPPREPAGRCFTPVTTDGVYFLVTAGGPTEQILRAKPHAATHTATHTTTHSQTHVSATARVRVPGPEPNIDGDLFSRMAAPRVQPPAIQSVQVRHNPRHTSAFDVVVNSAIGSTGCRLRLR